MNVGQETLSGGNCSNLGIDDGGLGQGGGSGSDEK